MKKTGKLWLRYAAWCAASFLVLIGPVLGVLIANRERYFTTAAETVKLGIGGAICFLALALLILGKLKVPGGIYICAFFFLMSWLMAPIVQDLMLLSGCALIGKTVDWLLVAPRVRRTRELIKARGDAKVSADITAEATAKALENVLKKQYEGRV